MRKVFLLVPLFALGLAGCGQRPEDRAASGALIGAGTGAILGSAVSGTAGGALIGAAVGGASGAVVGAATTPTGPRERCWINRYGEEVCRVRR